MVGNRIGDSSSAEIVALPGMRKRARASALDVPRTAAMTVLTVASMALIRIDSTNSGVARNFSNQRSVNPCGGNTGRPWP